MLLFETELQKSEQPVGFDPENNWAWCRRGRLTLNSHLTVQKGTVMSVITSVGATDKACAASGSSHSAELSRARGAATIGAPYSCADVRVNTGRIMIVDDEPVNIKVARKFLQIAGYSDIIETSRAASALDMIAEQSPDILLLDIMMPEISGLEILERLRESESGRNIPVVILTAMDDRKTKARALDLGASDFLTKPVDSLELTARVRNTLQIKRSQDALRNHAEELDRLVTQRTAELAQSRLEVIHCLGRAAEFRDNDTGHHVVRVGRYAGLIARKMGLDTELAELIEQAAPLHDAGKIGIPDSILLKPGRLAPEEFELIKKHCEYGRQIVGELNHSERRELSAHTDVGAKIMEVSTSPILQMAARIASTHHEKWDGTGYPNGLAGEDIPLEGRITAVADVFDALSSVRPYKKAFPLEKCMQILEEGRGQHFDPVVLDAFFACHDDVVQVMCYYAD